MAELPDTRSKRPWLDTPLAKKGLSIKKIMRSTPALFRNNAEDIVIKKYRSTWTKGGARVVQAICADRYFSRRPHTATIIGLDAKWSATPGKKVPKSRVPPLSDQKKVQVDCTCESYVFHGAEYALWIHGAAKIKRGNGAPAIVTNPSNVPFFCKHLYALAKQILRNKD